MNKTIILGVVLLICAIFGGSLSAQDTAITYQGQLKDGGNPANGNYDLSFAIYSTVSGGSRISGIVYVDDESVANGLFVADIDFGATLFDGADRWLEIGVRAGNVSNSVRTGYTTLAPRQRVASAPYSIMSRNSSALGGKTPAEFMASTADNWVNTTGDSMTGALIVTGSAPELLKSINSHASGSALYAQSTGLGGSGGNFSATGTNGRALSARSSGANARALEAFADGSGSSVGGQFEAAGGNDSKGVEGKATNSGSVSNFGGHFTASGASGVGVYGTATGTDGVGGRFSATGSNGRGVYAYASAPNAWALEAFAEGSGTSVGGRFDTSGGTNSKAVEGVAGNADAGTNYGGYFTAEGNSGEGVFGKSSGANGYGVHGEANGENGRGGYFSSTGTNGRALKAVTSAASAWSIEAYSEGFNSVAGHFETDGTHGTAVEGIAGNDAGNQNYGGHFRADGSTGRAIYGEVSSPGAEALYVLNWNSSYYAVLGTGSYAGDFHGPTRFQGTIDSGGFGVLNVTGNLNITGDYKYESAKTYTRFFAPNAFQKMSQTDDEYYSTSAENMGYLLWREGADSIAWISTPVILPQGATITEIRAYYCDNLDYDMTLSVFLRRRAYTTYSYTLLSQLSATSSGKSTTINSAFTSSITGGAINNDSYTYYFVTKIEYLTQMHTSEARYFCGIKVTYTLPNVTQ